MTSIGQRIKKKRNELGWTQEVFAHKVEISKSFLSDLENDKRTVSADTLDRLASVLGASLDYIMRGDPEGETVAKPEIEIPAGLSEFSSKANLSYPKVLALLNMQQQIIGHRSEGKNKTLDNVDWQKFYEAVKDFL